MPDLATIDEEDRAFCSHLLTLATASGTPAAIAVDVFRASHVLERLRRERDNARALAVELGVKLTRLGKRQADWLADATAALERLAAARVEPDGSAPYVGRERASDSGEWEDGGCNETHPRGATCTRATGHAGEHRAWGLRGRPPLERWTSEAASRPRSCTHTQIAHARIGDRCAGCGWIVQWGPP